MNRLSALTREAELIQSYNDFWKMPASSAGTAPGASGRRAGRRVCQKCVTRSRVTRVEGLRCDVPGVPVTSGGMVEPLSFTREDRQIPHCQSRVWHRREAGRTVNFDSFAESDCQRPRRLAPPSDRPAGFFAATRSRSSASRARVAAKPRPAGNRLVALTIIHARTVTSDSSRRTKRRSSIVPKR